MVEKNMYSAVIGHSILCLYIRYVNHVQVICTDFSPFYQLSKEIFLFLIF